MHLRCTGSCSSPSLQILEERVFAANSGECSFSKNIY